MRAFAFAVVCLLLAGCSTRGGLAAVRHLDFSLAGVAEAELAGVPLDRVRSWQVCSVLLTPFGRVASPQPVTITRMAGSGA